MIEGRQRGAMAMADNSAGKIASREVWWWRYDEKKEMREYAAQEPKIGKRVRETGGPIGVRGVPACGTRGPSARRLLVAIRV